MKLKQSVIGKMWNCLGKREWFYVGVYIFNRLFLSLDLTSKYFIIDLPTIHLYNHKVIFMSSK